MGTAHDSPCGECYTACYIHRQYRSLTMTQCSAFLNQVNFVWQTSRCNHLFHRVFRAQLAKILHGSHKRVGMHLQGEKTPIHLPPIKVDNRDSCWTSLGVTCVQNVVDSSVTRYESGDIRNMYVDARLIKSDIRRWRLIIGILNSGWRVPSKLCHDLDFVYLWISIESNSIKVKRYYISLS